MEVIGRLHPLLVHLPIGIVFIAVVLRIFSFRNKEVYSGRLIKNIVGIGLITSIATWITGYQHALSDHTMSDLVTNHKWSASVFTVLLGGLYLLLKFKYDHWSEKLGWFVCSIALTLAGDFGGQITHGYGGLGMFKSAPSLYQADPADSTVYGSIIEPILASKCWSCHSSTKQKGGLRLDGKSWILKGSKEGTVISTDTADPGELYTRINLPKEEEDVMPPNGKKQLSKNELAALNWWLKSGASFDLTIHQPGVPVGLVASKKTTNTASELPTLPIPAADPKVITSLRQAGIQTSAVASGSNFISLVLQDKIITAEINSLLKKIADNVLVVHASRSSWDPVSIQTLWSLPHLQQLNLSQSNINDTLLQGIQQLKMLKTLNLTNTRIRQSGHLLSQLTNLKQLYLFESKLVPDQVQTIIKSLPSTYIDTGFYQVPIWPSDTTLMTREEVNKILTEKTK